MFPVRRVPIAALLTVLVAAACQDGAVVEPAPFNLPAAFAGTPETPPGPLDSEVTPPYTEAQGFEFGTFWVCKSGTAAQFNVHTGTGEPTTPDADNPISVEDGQCFLAAQSTGDEVLNVRVEEVDDPTTELVRVKVWALIDPGEDPHFTEIIHDWPTDGPIPDAIQGPISQNEKLACIVIFYDEPVESEEGRMTGGGVKATGLFPSDEILVANNKKLELQLVDGLLEGPVYLGLTLHCDVLLSNNLEVNWPGHTWHIKKESLTDIVCTKPDLPDPPVAPLSSFSARALGHLDNGPNTSLIVFTFEDKGEPGTDDTIELTIYPGMDDSADPVLIIPFQTLTAGNFQMHYDQPHGQNGN